MTSPFLSTRQHLLLRQVLTAQGPVAPSVLEQALQVSRATINRDLRELLAAGFLSQHGGGRSTRYLATAKAEAVLRAKA